jgi:hypothetical protein
MDSSSEGKSQSPSESEMLTQKSLPMESIDDYFKGNGIEPSSIKIDISYDSPDAINRTQQEEVHQRKLAFAKFIIKEASVYAIGLCLVIALASVSLVVILDKKASSESQAWSKSTLTALMTAIAGYVFGKNSSS